MYDIKIANKDGGGLSKLWYFKANIVNWTYVSVFFRKEHRKRVFVCWTFIDGIFIFADMIQVHIIGWKASEVTCQSRSASGAAGLGKAPCAPPQWASYGAEPLNVFFNCTEHLDWLKKYLKTLAYTVLRLTINQAGNMKVFLMTTQKDQGRKILS